MVAVALLSVVVRTGLLLAERSPVTVLSRSETSSRRRLRVRIDSPVAIGVKIADLIANIQEIWRPYVEIDFWEAETEAAIYDDELRLRITERLPPTSLATAAVLGWIEFFNGRPKDIVTVSVAAVRSLMIRGKWLGRTIDVLPLGLQEKFVTRALGRSAAHEIGHYLLGSRAHAVRGLMRERMTVAEIMGNAPALYQLLPHEIGRLNLWVRP